MRRLIAFICAFLSAPGCFAIESADAFASALRAYEAERYEIAVTLMESVIATNPECARCAHILGRSYGRLAEQAKWTDAIGLAKKTRLALEQAVELDPEDADAVRDLIKYYRSAPGFLGGSDKKADALEQRLRESGHTS